MIGCDITSTTRFIKRKDRLAKRILTSNEYEVYRDLGETRQLEYLAGRFAAKEVCIKVLADTVRTYKDLEIEVINQKLICKYEDKVINLSISHQDTMVMAVGILN